MLAFVATHLPFLSELLLSGAEESLQDLFLSALNSGELLQVPVSEFKVSEQATDFSDSLRG